MNLNIDQESMLRFIEAVKQSKTYEENCAWLFIDKPFHEGHTVFVFPVPNIGLKGRTVFESFGPDKKAFAKLKKEARNRQLTRISNMHTHIIHPSEWQEKLNRSATEVLNEWTKPSPTDLKYARKFNDIIRCIVTVVFQVHGKTGQILAVVWHDQYGNIIDMKGNIDFQQQALKEAES